MLFSKNNHRLHTQQQHHLQGPTFVAENSCTKLEIRKNEINDVRSCAVSMKFVLISAYLDT